MIVVIEAGKNGKIEITKEHLQQMLNDAYEEGKAVGRECRGYPWYTYTTSGVTLNNSNMTTADNTITL